MNASTLGDVTVCLFLVGGPLFQGQTEDGFPTLGGCSRGGQPRGRREGLQKTVYPPHFAKRQMGMSDRIGWLCNNFQMSVAVMQQKDFLRHRPVWG